MRFPATGFFTGLANNMQVRMFYISGNNGAHVEFWVGKGAGGVKEVFVVAQNGTHWDAQTVTGITTDTWYCIEIRAPQPGTTENVRWWINGTEQAQVLSDVTNQSSWSNIYLGYSGQYNGGVNTKSQGFFDSVVVSPTYVGTTGNL